MMKKYLLTAFAVLALATTVKATDGPSVSIISASGDTLTTATLASVEKVEFADASALVILSGTGETNDTITYARKDIDKLFFSGIGTTGIKAVNAAGGQDKVSISANRQQLTISGAKAGSLVGVYDMNGRMMLRTKAQGQSLDIDATSLQPGAYIVRVGNKAVKILKK